MGAKAFGKLVGAAVVAVVLSVGMFGCGGKSDSSGGGGGGSGAKGKKAPGHDLILPADEAWVWDMRPIFGIAFQSDNTLKRVMMLGQHSKVEDCGKWSIKDDGKLGFGGDMLCQAMLALTSPFPVTYSISGDVLTFTHPNDSTQTYTKKKFGVSQ